MSFCPLAVVALFVSLGLEVLSIVACAIQLFVCTVKSLINRELWKSALLESNASLLLRLWIGFASYLLQGLICKQSGVHLASYCCWWLQLS